MATMNPVKRASMALPAAVGMTLAFFFVMQTLISSGLSVDTGDDGGKVVNFIKLDSNDDVDTKARKPTRQKVDKAPEMPTPKMKPQVDSEINPDMNVNDFSFATGLDLDASITGGDGEGEYLPIVKVAPVYPERALSRGIEGYVLLEYTVTKLGTVENIKVVEASPPGIFDRAAMQAAQKFKYKPRVINGQAMDVPGVQNLIRFQMAK